MQSSELQRYAEQSLRNERRLAIWRKRYMWHALQRFEEKRAQMTLQAVKMASDFEARREDRAYNRAFKYLHQAD